MDAHKNFARSHVATAPSPATTGTNLIVTTGEGGKFPVAPFNAAVWPADEDQTRANTEIVRVVTMVGDTITSMLREQEGMNARAIVAGDNIAATATAKTFTDIEAAITAGDAVEAAARSAADTALSAAIGASQLGGIIRLSDYMAGDGTDETDGFLEALDAWYLQGGGTIWCDLPPVSYRVDGQILIPNDGADTPQQPPLLITGPGTAMHQGQTSTPLGRSVLDLRYAGSGAKIVSLGLGGLEITRLNLRDGGSNNSTPFGLSTLTTVNIHGNRCDGNNGKSGILCDQDFWILGGTGTVANEGPSIDAPFQGYGSVIRDNCFSKIRRGAFLRTFCNDTVVDHNWFLHDCGSNLPGGAAIEILGHASNNSVGNYIERNTLETSGYVYPIKTAYASQNKLGPNGFYDSGSTTVAYYRCEATSVYNDIYTTFVDGAKPLLSDANSPSTQTVHTSQQGEKSTFPQGLTADGSLVRWTQGFGPCGEALNGDVWDWAFTYSGGSLKFATLRCNGEDVAQFFRVASGLNWVQLPGSAPKIASTEGHLTLAAPENFTVRVGDTICGVRLGGTKVGFWGTEPVVKPVVTGAELDGTAFASLLSVLAATGLFTNSTTVGTAPDVPATRVTVGAFAGSGLTTLPGKLATAIGTAGAPSYSATGDDGTGFNIYSGGVGISLSTVSGFDFSATHGVRLNGSYKVAWVDGAANANNPDSGFKRAGAALVQVTNGMAGYGSLDAAGFRVSGTAVVGAQGASVADATDAPSVIARLNDVLARLRAHGLIAT